MKHHIKELLTVELSPTYLSVIDDSARHAGHREASSGGSTHFNIVIVAVAFEGLTLVKRHRKIYETLQSCIDQGVHALAIQAYTPDEWEQKQ